MELSPRDILAKTLEAEAGNQGPLGMLSVGSVIMNRLMSPRYSDTLHGVILQPGQFSVWNSTTGYAGGEQGKDMGFVPTQAAYSVADALLDQNYNDPTGGATHFYNPEISNPSWGKDAGGNWKTIGNHIFGKPVKTRNNSMETNIINDGSPLLQNNQSQNQPKRGLFDFLGNAVGNSFNGLKNAISGDDPDASDRLAIALMTMSGSPNQFQPLIELAANDIQTRAATKTAEKGKNQTLMYLSKKAQAGDQNAANALELVDVLGPAKAVENYLTAKNGSSNIANKTEADRKDYPNGFTIQAFQSGETKYLLNGQEITDTNEIRRLQEEGIEAEIEIARRKKLAEGNAANQANLVGETLKSIDSTTSTLRNYARAKQALREAIRNGDNVTGLVEQFFPNVSVVAAELENARNALGLDVIGSVTFGALSKGELDLALTQGLPLGLEENQLLEFIERRELALTKMRTSLIEAARFLAKDKNTMEMYVDKILSKQEEIQNPYGDKSDDDLENLYVEVMSGTSTLSAANRQRIIDEVERRSQL